MRLSPVLQVLLVLTLIPTAWAGEVGLSATFGAPCLVVTRQAGVHVMREVEVPLAAGQNRLSFDFAQVAADPATANLTVLSPSSGVKLVELQQSGSDAARPVWVLEAAAPATCRLRLAYAVKGMDTSLSYGVALQPTTRTLSLEGFLSLRNGSSETFTNTTVVIPSGQRLTVDLKPGATVQQRLFGFADLPYEASYLYDNSRFRDSVRAIVTVARAANGELNRQSLPAGPVKVTAAGPDGLASFVADTSLPYSPPQEKIELDLGAVPEITTTRVRVRSDQRNAQSDIYRKPVLFDLEEQYDLTFENHRPAAAAVRVIEHVSGQWELLRSSLPGQKTDTGTVEFAQRLQPGEKQVLSYTVKRLNVEP